MNPTTFLVIGAGPSGLTTALTLASHGQKNIRIIDRRKKVSDSTKAIILWAGAMQVLDYLGLFDDIAELAIPLKSTSYEYGAGKRKVITLDSYQSGFAHPALSIPQPDIEKLLEAKLATHGIHVERGTEFHSLTQDDEGVEVKTSKEIIHTEWVVGADGAHSTVRDQSMISFDGKTLEDYFFLVDGIPKKQLPLQARYLLDSPQSTVVSVPLPGGRSRVFVRQSKNLPTLNEHNINNYLDRTGHQDLLMDRIDWASEFRVSENLASTLVKNRAVLVGDAAHIHSPAGGQGLNAGIQDGHTLGTSLARGITNDGTMHLELESYAKRRHTAAQAAIATTQQQLRIWTAKSGAQQFIRSLSLSVLSLAPRIQKKVLSKTAQQDALQLTRPNIPSLRHLTSDLRGTIHSVAESGLKDTVFIRENSTNQPPEDEIKIVSTTDLADGVSSIRVSPDLTVVQVNY